MAAQRFKIKGKAYKLDENLDKLPLLDIVLFDQQAEEVGLHATWGDVMIWSAEMAQVAEDIKAARTAAGDDSEWTDAEAAKQVKHPRMFLVMTATMWASRRMSGEDVNFGEMLSDFSLADIEWAEPTKDRPAPKDHKRKSPTRKASAPATARASKSPARTTSPDTTTTPEISKPLSESA